MKKRTKAKLLNLFSLALILFQNAYPLAVYATENVQAQQEELPSGSTPEPSTTPEVSPAPEQSPEPTPQPSAELTPTPTPEVTLEPTPTPTSTSQPEPTPNDFPQTSPNPPPATDSATPDDNNPPQEPQINATVIQQPADDNIDSLDLDSETAETSATISTNKEDYAPNEQVIITGTDLLTHHLYILIVSSSDEPAARHESQVTTNDQGSFVYVYQLDGNYRPNYLVEIFDGSSLVTSTTFTDSPTCQNDVNGANDEPGQKDLTRMCADYASLPTTLEVNWNWDDIAWSGGNTGDGCALFDTDNDGDVNYSLCVTIGGDPAAYISKTLYSCGDGKVDRCTNPISTITPSASTTCNVSNVTNDPFAAGNGYPNDTNASCSINMSDISATEAKLIDVCSYPSTQPNSDPSDCIVATQAQTSKLEIVKNLIPDSDPGRFDLQIDGSTLAFSQGDGGTTGEIVVLASAQGVSHTFGELAAFGTNLADYAPSVECRDNNGTGSLINFSGTNPWTINVVKDKDIVCTITNSRNQGTLIVEKVVINDNGGSLGADDFSFQVGGDQAIAFEEDGHNELTVAPGTYTVTEPAVAGYATTYNNCTNVEVPSGGSATCIITNNDVQSYVIVDKTVINDNGGQANPNDFNLTVDGNLVSDGVAYAVNPGQHTVGETNLSGYTAGDWGGDCSIGGLVTVNLGETKTCTITNDDQAATLIVKKVVINNNGGTSTVDSFSFQVNGGAVTPFEVDGQNDLSISAGLYSVTEPTVSGYDTTYNNCSNLNIPNGGTGTCTITNDDQEPYLKLVKEVTNDDGGTNIPADWELTASGPTGFTGQGPWISNGVSFDAGAYDLSESGPTGYTPSAWVCVGGNQTDTDTVEVSLGDSVTCTITNNDIAPELTVIKHVINDNGGTKVASDFTMNVTGANVSNPSFAGSEAGTVVTLNAGNYSVDENNVGGYTKTLGTNCSGTIAVGESKTCTITNDDQPGTLIVQKAFVGESGDATQFSYAVNGGSSTPFEADAQNEHIVPAGSYTVIETNPGSAYSASYDNCSNVVIPNGGQATCIVTNTKLPTLTVSKILSSIDPNESGVFDLRIDGITYATDVGDGGTTNPQIVSIGTHTASEVAGTDTISDNYHATIGGDCDASGLVSLAAGEDKTCTITNVRKTGEILLDKILFGGTALPSDWAFSILGWSGTYYDGDTIELPTGTYSISESSEVLGYSLTLVGGICSDQDGLSATLTVTENGGACSFTNTRDTGSIVVNKLVDSDNDGTFEGGNTEANQLGFTWIIDNSGPTAMGTTVSGIETTTDVVSHYITENLASGYHFAGWFTTGSTQYSCTNPEGQSLPILVNIAKNQTTDITLCNTRNTGTIVVHKDVQGPNGEDIIDLTPSFTVTLNDSNSQPIKDNGTVTYNNIPTGNHTVNETNIPTGYGLHSITVNPISVTYGQTTHVYIVNRQQAAGITLIKTVTNNNGGTADSDDFGISINGQVVTSGQNNPLPAYQNYTINEAGLPGYTFVSLTGDDRCPDVLGGSVTNLLPGEHVTCTITNDDDIPSLTLIKQVINNNGGNNIPADWTLTATGPTGFSDNGPQVSSDVSFDVGTYDLSESGPDGYDDSAWVCIGGNQTDDDSVEVGLGDSVTCTITNDDDAPTITLTKVVNNNYGGTALPDDFNLTIGGVPTTSSQTILVNANTPYALNETQLAGYQFVSITGDFCPLTLGGTVSLDEGQDISCTITNQDLFPTLKLVKQVTNNNGGTMLPGDWALTATGQDGFSDAGDSVTFHTVLAGETYTLSESQVDGYQASAWQCDGGTLENNAITLGLDQDVTCTITNDDIAPSLTLIKTVITNAGGTAVPTDWTLIADGPTAIFGDGGATSDNTFSAGTYNLSEVGGPEGYQASNWACVGGDQDGSAVTVDLAETVVCTIENDDIAPTLTLVKTVTNNNGGKLETSDFQAYINANPVDWEVAQTLGVGSYTASEDQVSGYTASTWTGECSSDGSVTLAEGQNKTCYIENDDQPGTLIVKKIIASGNGQYSDFSFQINGNDSIIFDSLDGQNEETVDAGVYTITEPAVTGYTASYDNCTEITVENGGQNTCTITNTRDLGDIVITKIIDVDGDLQTTEDQTPGVGWSVDVDPDGADTSDPSLPLTDDNGQSSASDLNTGIYWVSEGVIDGYDVVMSACTIGESESTGNGGTGIASFGGVEVQKDTTTHCTFYNSPNGTIHGYKWHDRNIDTQFGDNEEYLPGWTINLYKSNGEGYDLIETMETDNSDHYGWYWFENLFPGDYKVCEELQAGWQQTYPTDNDGCYLVTLPDDTEPEFDNAVGGYPYNFGNVEYGSVTVYKTIDPEESQQLFDFKLDGDATGSAQIAGWNEHTFENLLPGDYSLTELVPEGWYLDYAYCDQEEEYENGSVFNLTAGQEKSCTFHNKQFGTITVTKYNDLNENGQWDLGEPTLEGWEMNLYDGDEDTLHQTTGENGQTVFENLYNQNYYLSETLQDNWIQTELSCETQEVEIDRLFIRVIDEEGSRRVYVPAGQNIDCRVGNHHILPILTIEKSNDALTTKAPGQSVVFTLTISLAENDLADVKVIDLPANGFTYRSGSWTATSSVRGNIKNAPTTEPTYASPGTWNLGDMIKDEVVTLTYITDISNDQDSGNYPDLAWAYGQFDGEDLLANADTGNFVGTTVAVNVNPNPTDDFGAVGEVLGISTQLPSTGANTLWLFISFGLITTGYGLRKLGNKGQEN